MNAVGLHINGVGAVSPAGWSSADLVRVIREGEPLPSADCERPGAGRDWSCPVRLVPPAPPDKVVRGPRFRRASAISRYAVAACMEALQDAGYDPAAPPPRLGILFCMMNGCVKYTGRFYQEVLDNPSQASPLIFPETVFNAPASHIAAMLGVDGAVSTIIGQANCIMEALDMAAVWIHSGVIDHCLVVSAEEGDWLSAEALSYYHTGQIAAEGAGALLVSASGPGPRLQSITGPLPYHTWRQRGSLLPALTAETGSILIDDCCGVAKQDRDELRAWSGTTWAARHSPKRLIGETMGTSSALQLVLATCEARDKKARVVVSMPGTNSAAYACAVE